MHDFYKFHEVTPPPPTFGDNRSFQPTPATAALVHSGPQMKCHSILPPCFASLPHHSFNYQDFSPAVYGIETSENHGGSKTWRKRKSKRAIPENVIRERQLRRNERERARQNRINDAFDVLRNTIPEFLTPCKKGQKLTQIETLRLAKHYIAGLRDLLDNESVASSN